MCNNLIHSLTIFLLLNPTVHPNTGHNKQTLALFSISIVDEPLFKELANRDTGTFFSF